MEDVVMTKCYTIIYTYLVTSKNFHKTFQLPIQYLLMITAYIFFIFYKLYYIRKYYL